jgi:hypothetical protein
MNSRYGALEEKCPNPLCGETLMLRIGASYFLVFLCQLSLSQISEAAPDRNQLVSKVIETGKQIETLPGEEVRYLEKINPNNPELTRTADYLSARGIILNGTRFHLLEINAVSENWLREENEWKIFHSSSRREF